MPHYFAVNPPNWLELSGPVLLFVRPGDPGSLVSLPFRRHTRQTSRWCIGRHGHHEPSQRCVIGPYASTRLSLRKGQFRRTSSICFGSHSTTSTDSSDVGACAITRPNGSATKELPQNSNPLSG